ncbi:MAG: hypothetical protein PHQ27_05315 [Victivallales bacterium]|nr:hypothetical protein [Victivallales bacterium]
MKKSQIIIAFIIVFLSGILIGGVGGWYYSFFCNRLLPRPPHNVPFKFSHKIARDLDLTEEQQQKLQPAFEKWNADLSKVNHEWAPKIKKVFSTLYDDIEASIKLNPKQKEKLTQIRQMTQRMKWPPGPRIRRHKPPLPPPPPPPQNDGGEPEAPMP